MKTTIFIRILLATLLPLIFVFAMVITTISNIIYANGAKSAQKATLLEARQIARQFSDNLDDMAGILGIVSQSMAELGPGYPEMKAGAQTLLLRLLEAEPSFHSAWFFFEPGSISPGHVYQILQRQDGQIREIQDMSPEFLSDPKRLPSIHIPMRTGRLHLEMAEQHAHDPSGGTLRSASMAAPIMSGGRAMGAMGIGINYSDKFVLDEEFGSNWQTLLFTDQGKVVYSSAAELEGGNFFELPFSNAADLQQVVAKREPFVGEGWLQTEETDYLICLYPITHPGSEAPLFLYLGTPVENIYSMARSSVELIISTSILGLVLLSFCVFLATRNIVRPIKRLTVDFNRVSTGDVQKMSPPEEDERHSNVVELDILEDALWKMLSQINQNHELRLKATEEQVEREKIEAASQAKSQFFASMSHEIRTPMNAILGISEILLHHDLSGPEKKYVQDIKISSEALLTIINDILDISRLESGKLELADRDFDFSLFLENIRTMGEYLSASNHLEFRYCPTGDLPACLRGDDVRLRQILINLLSNACKFTSEGSVALQVHEAGGRLIFAVQDTGPGISEEQQKGLFEPFKRIESARNLKIQGTGLGLSITKTLVGMMDGSLKVDSAPGKGSTFTVEIPFVPGDASGLEQGQGPKRTAYKPGVKILVVDDNEINLSVAEGLLKSLYNFDSDLALSGREALEMMIQKEYDVVFMDHMMPDMDGLETTRRIRAMGGKYLKIPILALTANAVKGVREIMLEAGLDDYLAKPIQVDELESVLRKWLPDELKAEQP